MFASLHTAQLTTRRVQTSGIVDGLFNAVRKSLKLRAERRALARLDDAILADIGLTRAEAMMEAERPAWDVPDNWRR